MANHSSAEKRHRQNLKRNERNRAGRSEVRSAVRKVRELSANSEIPQDLVQKELKIAVKTLDKAATHGLLHKNTARRSISRLQKRANARSSVGA
jgi:small subunit ribosomal protein S20